MYFIKLFNPCLFLLLLLLLKFFDLILLGLIHSFESLSKCLEEGVHGESHLLMEVLHFRIDALHFLLSLDYLVSGWVKIFLVLNRPLFIGRYLWNSLLLWLLSWDIWLGLSVDVVLLLYFLNIFRVGFLVNLWSWSNYLFSSWSGLHLSSLGRGSLDWLSDWSWFWSCLWLNNWLWCWCWCFRDWFRGNLN